MTPWKSVERRPLRNLGREGAKSVGKEAQPNSCCTSPLLASKSVIQEVSNHRTMWISFEGCTSHGPNAAIRLSSLCIRIPARLRDVFYRVRLPSLLGGANLLLFGKNFNPGTRFYPDCQGRADALLLSSDQGAAKLFCTASVPFTWFSYLFQDERYRKGLRLASCVMHVLQPSRCQFAWDCKGQDIAAQSAWSMILNSKDVSQS